MDLSEFNSRMEKSMIKISRLMGNGIISVPKVQ